MSSTTARSKVTARTGVVRTAGTALTLILLLALAACAGAGYKPQFEPELFGLVVPAKEPRAPGRIVIVGPESGSYASLDVPIKQLRDSLTIPIDRIVLEAAIRAFNAEFDGGVLSLLGGKTREASGEAPAAKSATTPDALSVRPEVNTFTAKLGSAFSPEALVISLPIAILAAGYLGPPAFTEAVPEISLIVSVRVLGDDGQVDWESRYESGTISRGVKFNQQLRAEGKKSSVARVITILAHRAALDLMQKAARDVRGWRQTEHKRERSF